MSLVTERQVEKLLIEAAMAYIKEPSDAGRDEVSHYAKLLLRLRGGK